MKKFFAILILIFTSTLCLACGRDAYITFKTDEIYLNLGNAYHVFSDDVVVHNSSSDFEIVSLDEDVAVVSGNVIYSLSEGETTIRIRLVENSAIYTDFKLIVTNITYATGVTIKDEKVYVNMGKDEVVYNPITYENLNVNEVPEVTYNDKIIDYDYLTGKITPKALGETVVVVLFRDCNVSFRVGVINEIYALSLEIPDCTLLNGYNGKFFFSMFPDNANTYSFFVPENDFIDVASNGTYVTRGVGEITAYCTYYSEFNGIQKLASFRVKVIDGVDDIDVCVMTIDSHEEKDYFLKENKYRLHIENHGISSQYIYISGVDFAGEIVENASGMYVDFYFTKTGSNEIVVDVKLDGYNSIITKKITCDVSLIEDINVLGYWSIYQTPIAKQKDGKYHIYLESNDDPSVITYIRFEGRIGDTAVGGIDVYNITGGDRVKTDSNTFNPTARGEYTFEFEYNGNILGLVYVVVE